MNVAKVREVIGHVKTVSVPMSHPALVGVFHLRGRGLPLIDLQLYFDPSKPSQSDARHVILMEFNDLQVGFQVDGVDRIYRLSWEAIRAVPAMDQMANAAITKPQLANVVSLLDYLVNPATNELPPLLEDFLVKK